MRTIEDDTKEAPMRLSKVAESPGWAKLWDHTLDLGWKAVQGLKMLSWAMSHHGKGEQPCHILASHHHEQQMSLLESSNLTVMLSDLHLDFLSKFKFSTIIFLYFKICIIPIHRAHMG